jgi:AraC family transcriptional regulator
MMQDSIHYFETHASESIELVARRTPMPLEALERVYPFYDFSLEEPVIMKPAGRIEPRPGCTRPGWLKHAMNYVQDTFLEKTSLSFVAKEAGVHPIHVSRMFQQFHGCSVGEFVRSLRLDWCAKRLVQSHESIASIAMQAGFADQAHFSRQFRQHTGLTPKAFRSAMPWSFFKGRGV